MSPFPARTAALLLAATLVSHAPAQEIRRALPPDATPPRALPIKKASPTQTPVPKAPAVTAAPAVKTSPTPAPRPKISPPAPAATTPPATPAPTPTPSEESAPPRESAPAPDAESPDQRQLNYANGFFARKMYDLAIPEYEKFLGQFPGAAGRASAYFYLGESYRATGKAPAAKSSFQSVVDEFGESEFAGPAAYGVAEILFKQKDYSGALPFFRKAASKTKEAGLALSARYFEARSLESLGKKEEAAPIYAEVAGVKDPNPFREDSRTAAAGIFMAKGRKFDAFRQYEALAAEASKPALKAEAAVRAGLLAAELHSADRAKVDKGMIDRAVALLQKGRGIAEAGRYKAIADVALIRLFYQTGQFAQAAAEYKKSGATIPDEVKAEVMLLVANSHRQLGQPGEAEALYKQINEKYAGREEAKDASYQRLINLYNSGAKNLEEEIDAFLATNPEGERGDQARLLKAEALYKHAKFPEAAALFTELRASQLNPKLRAEAAYKLGWCHVQTKNAAGVIEAFSYFINSFADHAEIPSALAQRAVAFQELKNYEGALGDLNNLIATYPKAKEREAALQQKALILGQQGDNAAMAGTFQQLLKEFPKTPVAAQAHYFIGKAAFDNKQYKQALAPLNTARNLSAEQYYELATVRIISSHFYQRDRAALIKELDAFAARSPEAAARIPTDIVEWLGFDFYNEKNYASAEKYLGLLRNRDPKEVKPDTWFYLGDARSKLQKWEGAEEAYEHYLQTSDDPGGKAKVLLALGEAKIGANKLDEALRIAEEIMRLQPEGRVNAEARLLAGEVQTKKEQHVEAGKTFMSVALLNADDPAITPRALEKAVAAYEKAGQKEEAERAAKQLRERFPQHVGG